MQKKVCLSNAVVFYANSFNILLRNQILRGAIDGDKKRSQTSIMVPIGVLLGKVEIAPDQILHFFKDFKLRLQNFNWSKYDPRAENRKKIPISRIILKITFWIMYVLTYKRLLKSNII